jgi:hypothetical protein
MARKLQLSPFWDELETEHRSWLTAFNPQFLCNWDKLLNSDYEAALCEAATRRLLQNQTIKVEPNEDLTGSQQRPDFRCTHPEGTFFVEVACIPIDKAAEESGLPYPSQSGPRGYWHLNNAVFLKCKGKASQCSKVTNPTLVAVGTLHTDASHLCFQKKFADMLLMGETRLSWLVNTQTGAGVGDAFQTTEFYSAAFLGQNQQREVGDYRRSISGILLCGFGIAPPIVLGVLHPGAVRPFNRLLLPAIEFGEVQVNAAKAQLCTSWSGGDDE